MIQVIWMHPRQPAVAKLGFKWATRKLEPGLIEVVAKLVGTRHPDHYGGSVCDQAEALLALVDGFQRLHQLDFGCCSSTSAVTAQKPATSPPGLGKCCQ